jgi:hypothetical protein
MASVVFEKHLGVRLRIYRLRCLFSISYLILGIYFNLLLAQSSVNLIQLKYIYNFVSDDT